MLAAWVLTTLFLLPLYPKIGLLSVSGTYIPVRADDILIAILGLVWAGHLIVHRRRPAAPPVVSGPAVSWVAITFVSLVVGTVVLGSISPITGLAFWAKPLEYVLVGWIFYDLVSQRLVSMRAVLVTVFASTTIVVTYAMAEHFGLAPHLPGLTPPPGVVTSTFGDVHELAAYLGIVTIVLVATRHQLRGNLSWLALLALVPLVASMFFTAVRSEYVALGLCLLGLAFWRPARVPAIVGISIMALLFAMPFVARLLPPVGSGQSPPAVVDPSDNVTERFLGFEVSSSFNERVNVKWRSMFDRTMRSPIIGLGPSAATEAADGYYMRSFVESGIAGLTAFLVLIGALIVSAWRAARQASGFAKALAVGMVASTAFVAMVSILIDTWAASRVMELYWPLMGTALGAAARVTALDRAPAEAVALPA